MARRTGSRAIFDFSTMCAEAPHSLLQTADPAGHVSDIKVSASASLNPSLLVLYSAAKEVLHASSKSLDLLIWGGVSTPEAAAALLTTGAAGIVFESVHCVTDLVVMDDRQRQQLARLRLDSTALVGLDLQVPCRLFNEGNSLAFKKIEEFGDSLCAAETQRNRRPPPRFCGRL